MQGIIFDLDGTLIDSLPAISSSVNAALQSHNCRPHETSAIRGFIGDGARTLVLRALGESHSDLIEPVLTSFRDHYAQNWQSGTSIYPKISEVIQLCQQQGKRLAVLSNKPHEYTQTIVSQLFPSNPFEIVWGERKEIPQKPNPQALRLIAEQWNFTPQQCCMIGDSVIDVLTAQRANVMSIAVGWGYHDDNALKDAKPDILFKTASELQQWLSSFDCNKNQ